MSSWAQAQCWMIQGKKRFLPREVGALIAKQVTASLSRSSTLAIAALDEINSVQ
jgi:hypothetical protein